MWCFLAAGGQQKARIGFIGTGVMGRWVLCFTLPLLPLSNSRCLQMCQHLMKAGYSASVYNRSRAKTEPLKELGATVCNTPKEVAQRSDVVFSIVGYPADVREVWLASRGCVQDQILIPVA